MPDLPWPPSPDSLPPLPAGGGPRDPIATMRSQHRELAAIMSRLVALVDAPGAPSLGPDLPDRLPEEADALVSLLEDHRDMEESLVFPELLEREPSIGPILDELGDDHIRIFEEWNRVSRSLTSRDAHPAGLDGPRLFPLLRSFIEHLWGHTLGEEKLLDRISRPAP